MAITIRNPPKPLKERALDYTRDVDWILSTCCTIKEDKAWLELLELVQRGRELLREVVDYIDT